MTDYKLSRRELMGLAAGIVAGGIAGGAMEGAAAAPVKPGKPSRASAATIQDPRCEYLTDPLGIDERTPRLSWNVQSSARGWRQSAYEIAVASTPEHLSSGHVDLWESGKVSSSATNHIEYQGKPLMSRQQCFWRVRSFDAAGGATPWSKPAHWEMGLLEEKDWKSSAWIGRQADRPKSGGATLQGVSWIWFAEPGVDPTAHAPNGSRWFRRAFNIPAGRKCVSARLLFTVDDAYDVRLNGKHVVKGGGEDDWRTTKSQDVTSHIVAGPNVLAIVGENVKDGAGLACRLVVMLDQGDPVIVDSGAGWKAFNHEVAGWDTVAFNDGAWPDAQVVAAMGASPWGVPAPPAEPTASSDPAPYLRREFTSKDPVKRARLYACGLGYADIYLNGKRLGGASERDTAYTAFDKRVLYTTYDVTALVALGDNALGAVLGKGWYDVHDLATWGFEHASWRGPQRLRLVLEVDYVNGSHKTIVSDGSWKSSTGPIVRDGIYSGEIYDARLDMPGWNRPGFAAGAAWAPAMLMEATAGKLAARRCPPVAVTQDLAAVEITEPSAGVYVVDFGQNFSGHVRLHIANAPAGTSITMRYGELVHKDGSLDTSNIDYYMNKTTPKQLFQTDTYICKGGADEVWEQRFSYSGFRYAEVTGFPGKPEKQNFTGRFAHTAVASAGEFSCSDEMLNKIQSATRWSYLSNAQSIPTDCPQREKNGWTGDAHLAAEAGLMNFQSASFYTKWLDDVADNQVANGQVGNIIPSGGWGSGGCHPAWDSAYPIIAWDLYRYGGDKRILSRHYDHIARYVDYLAGRLESDVIPFGSLGDWLPWKTQTPSELSSTVYMYHDSCILRDAAVVLGRDADAQKYGALADRVKAGFNAKWYHADKKMYASGEQTAQAMPLFFGLTAPDNRDDVFAALVADIERQGHVDCGILGAKYILRVLNDGGRADLVHHVVARKEQPSWAWWITQGATTLWEQWTESDSHNHIMFGDVSNWFFQGLAGIGLDPESPGFAHILVRPQVVGGITWAKGSHLGPHGKITTSWTHQNGKFHLDVTVPANSTATVWIPTSDSAKVTEGGLSAEKSRGVTLVRQEDAAAVYSVGSGTYSFTA
ncbi:MAG: family 78 glycoside hydrolase catalytic domain [Capsulimonas sp.]|uniref:family 78 glycoside hydrolase catalytic domain n=1 Tax=Capsulimonas sp. TaxID=2494211 RepID=UPI003264DFEF